MSGNPDFTVAGWPNLTICWTKSSGHSGTSQLLSPLRSCPVVGSKQRPPALETNRRQQRRETCGQLGAFGQFCRCILCGYLQWQGELLIQAHAQELILKACQCKLRWKRRNERWQLRCLGLKTGLESENWQVNFVTADFRNVWWRHSGASVLQRQNELCSNGSSQGHWIEDRSGRDSWGWGWTPTLNYGAGPRWGGGRNSATLQLVSN